MEGAFYVEDAIKVRPSLELRIGFRGESTNGWNEAHGRASNYAFDSNGVVGTQPRVGGSAFSVNNAKILPAPRVAPACPPFAPEQTCLRAGCGFVYGVLRYPMYHVDQNIPVT